MEHVNALPAGTRLAEYEVVEVLGAGGFGITYRAWDTTLEKYVAIKEYLPRDFATRTNTRTVVPTSPADRADYAWGLTRFLDEARTLARFDHPHVNTVHRHFEAHGTAYLVLEYVEGETLSAVLGRQRRLNAAQIAGLLTDVLSGLEEVHAAGFVHRDLKPGNLMVRPDGNVVVLDFGAARQAVGQRSKSITSILTPGYAPIEQYDTKAEDVGPWSDIYALGMVAYRCISGLKDGDLPDAVTRSRAARKGSGDVEPAASIGQGRYDARLLRAIDWAMTLEEDARPQSIGEWRTALPPLDDREPPRPSPPPISEPARSQSSSRWATVAGMVALIIAVGAGAYWLGQRTPVMPTEQAAVPEPRQADSPASQESVSASPAEEEVGVSPPSAIPESSAPAPPDPAAIEAALGLGRAERRMVQQGLAAAGQEPGPTDGLFGGEQTRTRQAIQAWQAAKGLGASGYLTREQADTPMALGQEAAEARRVAEAAAEREAQEEAARQGRVADEGRAAAVRQVGEVFRDCPTCPELVVVPAGSFVMGSQLYWRQHQVTIPQPFAVGVYEVTFGEWDACVSGGGCGYRPRDGGRGRGRRPVMNVNWEDAQAYVGWLSEQTGKRYRLLSEAEWEYVARAGTTTEYWWGDEIGRNRANCNGCGSQWDDERTAPVGSFQPNGFGLYDVHGNVWEWVQDCWNRGYAGAPRDGRAWETGDCSRRVLRGGSWYYEPRYLRSANRIRNTADYRFNSSGFRIARSLP